jgi:hypothetical protein
MLHVLELVNKLFVANIISAEGGYWEVGEAPAPVTIIS